MARILRNIGLFCGGIGGGAIASIMLLLAKQQPACACANPAASLLGAINRAQQAYYFEHGEWAEAEDAIAAIGRSALLDGSSRYQYRFEQIAVEGSPMMVSYATPKDANFYPRIGLIKGRKRPTYRSYVGAVVVDAESDKLQTILCVSDSANGEAVLQPIYAEGVMSCPVDSHTRS